MQGKLKILCQSTMFHLSMISLSITFLHTLINTKKCSKKKILEEITSSKTYLKLVQYINDTNFLPVSIIINNNKDLGKNNKRCLPLLPEKQSIIFFVTFILSAAFLLPLNFVKNCWEKSWFRHTNFQRWALLIKFRYSDIPIAIGLTEICQTKKAIFTLFLLIFFTNFRRTDFFSNFCEKSRNVCLEPLLL